VGEEMMAEKDRLAALEVGVTRHEDLAVRLDPVEERRDKVPNRGIEGSEPAFQPQTDIGGDLVVAGAGGVELAAGPADEIGEACLDRHVNIFLRFVGGPGAGPKLVENPRKAMDQRRRLVCGKDAGLSQHRHVGDRALDVLFRDPQVHLQGRCKSAEKIVLVAVEKPAQEAHSPSEILLPPRVRSRNALRRMKPAASA
jgi:hypothetical protein